jgi:hypothetical protein
MADFYHVTVVPRDGVTREEIEAVLNHAIDWYRYHVNCWIIYTTSTHEEWYARLEPLVKAEGKLLICKVEYSSTQGWVSKQFWDWWSGKSIGRRDTPNS